VLKGLRGTLLHTRLFPGERPFMAALATHILRLPLSTFANTMFLYLLCLARLPALLGHGILFAPGLACLGGALL